MVIYFCFGAKKREVILNEKVTLKEAKLDKRILLNIHSQALGKWLEGTHSFCLLLGIISFTF